MNKRTWLIIGIAGLVILAIILVVVPLMIRNSMNNAIKQAIAPLSEVDQQVSTQLSSWMNPTPTILPDPITIVHEVRGMARLITIQYTIEKVITAEVGQGMFEFLVGDKILFVAHGYVQAGIDLEKLKPEDITVKDDTVYIDLPEPEIFLVTLDNEKSFVYDREIGFLSSGNQDLETAARRSAEEEIRQAAIDDGIFKIAEDNAKNYISGLVHSLGFTEVIYEDE